MWFDNNGDVTSLDYEMKLGAVIMLSDVVQFYNKGDVMSLDYEIEFGDVMKLGDAIMFMMWLSLLIW